MQPSRVTGAAAEKLRPPFHHLLLRCNLSNMSRGYCAFWYLSVRSSITFLGNLNHSSTSVEMNNTGQPLFPTWIIKPYAPTTLLIVRHCPSLDYFGLQTRNIPQELQFWRVLHSQNGTCKGKGCGYMLLTVFAIAGLMFYYAGLIVWRWWILSFLARGDHINWSLTQFMKES